MSGLFATLASAALGDDKVLTARPLSAFEPASDGSLADWDEDSAAVKHTEYHDELAQADSQLTADVARRQRMGLQSKQVNEVLLTEPQAGPEVAGAVADVRPKAHNLTRSARRKVAEIGHTQETRSSLDALPLLPLSKGMAAAGDAATGESAAADNDEAAQQDAGLAKPVADAAFLPPATSADHGYPIESALPQTDRLTSVQRSAAGRTLTIGRIEVRPPPAAPPPAPTYRAQAIPRAMPRQSLDDYRRRGR